MHSFDDKTNLPKMSFHAWSMHALYRAWKQGATFT